MTKYNPKRYTLKEENSHKFYQMPKEPFINPKYKELSSNAKLLYTVLLDRKELSRKNNWVNEHGHVYLIYTRENIAELLGVSMSTTTRTFNELTRSGLIEEERQGLNKPNKIYVLRLDNSGHVNLTSQDKSDLATSDTEYSETDKRYNIKDKSLTIHSLYRIKDLIKVLGEEQANIINQYALTYSRHIGNLHPNLKREQLEDIGDKIDEFSSDLIIDYENWESIINEYFESGNYGDGNINRFFYGDAYEGVIRGLFY